MNCPKCGGTIPAKSNFCTHCGANLTAVAAEESQMLHKCPKCGYEPEHPSKFCIRCGASMLGTEEEPTKVVDIPKQEAPKQAAPQQQPKQAQPQQQAAQQPKQAQPQQQAAQQPKQARPQQQQYQPQQQARPQQQQYQQPQGGYAYQQYAPNQAGYYNAAASNSYLGSLLGKLKASWVLCLIGAILACIGAAIMFGTAIYLTIWLGAAYGYVGRFAYYSEEYVAILASMITLWILAAAMLAGAIVNFVYCARTKRYMNQIRINPTGITSHFASSGRAVGFLIVNIILVGGLGIIGAIFAIVSGSYVRSNREQFQGLERQYHR